MVQLKNRTEVNGTSALMRMGRGLQDLAFYVAKRSEPSLEAEFVPITLKKNKKGWFSISGASVGFGRPRLNFLPDASYLTTGSHPLYLSFLTVK